MPDAHRAVLGAAHDDGELGVEADDRDVLCVALQRLHTRLVLVVPHLDQPGRRPSPSPPTGTVTRAFGPGGPSRLGADNVLVIGAADEVGLLAARVVVEAVHTLVVAFERVVARRRVEAPDL